MISFRIALENYLTKSHWKAIWQKQGNVIGTEFKVWEIEVCLDTHYLFELSLDTGWKNRDHAGPALEINFLGLAVRLAIADVRHWNYTNNSWEIYE